jgi:hypothetical protein
LLDRVEERLHEHHVALGTAEELPDLALDPPPILIEAILGLERHGPPLDLAIRS